MKYKIKNQNGEVIGEQELSSAVFGVKINENLVYQAAIAQMGNRRQIVAHTKDRSEVRGGGRKPWRQKGTGRARAGSSRSPIWKGGGVTFGPRNIRNFAKKINKKMKIKAILMALSDKVKNKSLIILDEINLEKPKTKIADIIINKVLGVKNKNTKEAKEKDDKTVKQKKQGKRGVLLVVEKRDDKLRRAFNNLPDVKLANLNNINITDLLKYRNLVLTIGAIKKLEARYGKSEK